MSCFQFTGIATETLFYVMCFGWKEWRALSDSEGLKYEYRIRQAGLKRSLLFYFGRDASASGAVFPVGSFEKSFGNKDDLIEN